MKRIILTTCFIVGLSSMSAQQQLEVYVREGLENNESIRQQNFALQKSLYALREAKSLFFPTMTAAASYTLSDGGRTIAIPVGDMLNPIYTTLNQLTGKQDFPQVDNMEVQLNPNNYYDAHLRFSLPVIDAEIYYNKQIKTHSIQLEEIKLRLFKRELVKEIKIAYFQYAQAKEAVEIYRNALSLAGENLRINRSLRQHGKTNQTTVLRSENEVTKAETILASALVTQQNSTAYFNFLLNKPLDSEIISELPLTPHDASSVPGEREELSNLNQAQMVLMLNKKLNKSFVYPKLRTFVDVGSQGFDWKINNKTAYYLFGVSLEWSFSLGGRDAHRVKQVSIEQEKLKSQTSQVEEQLNLQVLVAHNSLLDATQQYEASLKQLTTAERYYSEQMSVYREGALLYIEMLDAYNQYIQAKIETNITQYAVYIKQAELERANAGFNLQ